MVQRLPEIEIDSEPCEECIMVKQSRLPFPKGRSCRAKAPLELIHTDICGKMRTPSFNHHTYFLTFIDDYSRMTWVHFLKEKSEAFGVFKQF